MLLFFFHSVSQSGSSWLINNSFNFKSRNLSCIFSCLSLWVIEISRDCNNSSVNSFTKVSFSSLFHFHKNKCTHLRGGIVFSSNLNPSITAWMSNNFIWKILSIILYWLIFKSSSYQSLCCEDSILRISYRLSFSSSSNKSFTFICESNNRWCCSYTFCIFNNFRCAPLHNCYTRVGSSKVNAYDNTSFLWRKSWAS